MIGEDVSEYYSWFLNRRFGLEFIKPKRGAHVTFINDSINDISQGAKTDEEVNILWEGLKERWDGKEIEVILNLKPFSNGGHWWLIVDHKYREGLQKIRSEIGLGKPYFGMHMTVGSVNDQNLDHSKYINSLNEKGFIEINKDYGTEQ